MIEDLKRFMIVNLEPQTSLALTLNTSTNFLSFHKEKMCKPKSIADVYLEDLKPLLLNTSIQYPDYVYTEYRGVYSKAFEEHFTSSGIRHNLIYLPNSMLGVEFVKSHIFTSKNIPSKVTSTLRKLTMAKKKQAMNEIKFSCILECLHGSCIVVMQKRVTDIDAGSIIGASSHSVEEAGIAKLKKGERIPIPAGYDYFVTNIKSSSCLVSQVYKQAFRLNYSSIKNAKGFGYYVIRKNGRVEVVPNSMYKHVPKIRNIKVKDLMKFTGLNMKGSLYNSIGSGTGLELLDNLLADFTEYTEVK